MAELVYRDYDQEALDLEYDMRRRVPDHAVHYARLQDSSDRAVRGLDCQLDVAYGAAPGQKLDIFPAAQPNAPIHVFIHGGYWRAFDKSGHRFVAWPFVEAGATVLLLNYDLCPNVTMNKIVGQNRAAIRWVYNNAASFGANCNRLYVCGHSAGGHLTAMMMSTEWSKYGLPWDAIKGGCAISGLHDLEPLRLSYLNSDIQLDSVMVQRNSPIHNLPGRAGPQIIAVGGGETDEFRRQSRTYCDAWTGARLNGEYFELPELDHIMVVAELESADSPLTQKIFQQMGIG